MFAKFQFPRSPISIAVLLITILIADASTTRILSFFAIAIIVFNNIDFIWYLATPGHSIQYPVGLIMHVVNTIAVNFGTCTDSLT